MNADIFCIYVDQVLVPALAQGRLLSSSTIPAATRSRAREATEPLQPQSQPDRAAFAWLRGAAAQNRRRLDRLRTVGSPAL